MSGRDERKISDIPDCPNCGRKPKYWTLGHIKNNPLCWVFPKDHLFGSSRNIDNLTVTARFVKNNKLFDTIKHKITYAWCSKCEKLVKDIVFLSSLVLTAKQLPKTMRSDV